MLDTTPSTTSTSGRWSDANPFAQRKAERLRTAGGQHRSPGPLDHVATSGDRLTAEYQAEADELHQGPEPCPF